eukprot:1950697-Prymnesium_polylepis.1
MRVAPAIAIACAVVALLVLRTRIRSAAPTIITYPTSTEPKDDNVPVQIVTQESLGNAERTATLRSRRKWRRRD